MYINKVPDDGVVLCGKEKEYPRYKNEWKSEYRNTDNIEDWYEKGLEGDGGTDGK